MSPPRGVLQLAVNHSPPSDGLRCALYCRKSNEDDASTEFKSVVRQIERGRDYATRKGWVVDDSLIFSDDGVSGFEFARRPGLMRLLNAAEAKAFDVLVMSEPSRLGREMTETAYCQKRLNDAGVAVWFFLEYRQAQLDSAVGKFIESVHSFGAELGARRSGSAPATACASARKRATVAGDIIMATGQSRSTRGGRTPTACRCRTIPTGGWSPRSCRRSAASSKCTSGAMASPRLPRA